MFLNTTNSSFWPCLDSMSDIPISSWNFECLLCRLGGAIILLISMICFTFNLRYLIWYRPERYRNPLVLSLFFASLLVLTTSVPTVLLQLFTCHRHCSKIFCRIEGFTSYLAGCLCMLIYTILAINRYLLLRQCNQQLFCRYSTIICWILSIGWTLPPVYDYWTSYIPEGLGFHCSINWNNHSKTSQLYILLSFIGMYFIPLIILFVVNLRVHQEIRNIYSSLSSHDPYQQTLNKINVGLLNQREHIIDKRISNQSNTIMCYIHKAAERKRFKIEYRFTQAIIFLVSAYLISWTPYSIVAVLQLFRVEFIFQHAFFITLSAIIAKLSVILTPCVYLSIMNCRLFKELLFQ